MKELPERKTGLSRIGAAFVYSLNGLRLAVKKEAAFRQEVGIWVVLGVGLFFMPISLAFKILLFFATTLVLIIELLNSAIEAVVDLAAPEYHELAKQAKDMGSAAVFISLLLAGFLWIGAAIKMLTG